MSNDTQNPQIDFSKIAIGGGIGGALIAIGSVSIILLGLPELGYFLGGAIALGCAIAVVLHFAHHSAHPRNPAAHGGTNFYGLTR